MNNKNSQTPKNVDNNKIIEEAAKKLEKFEKCQKSAEKYFKDRENIQKAFEKMEKNLKDKVNLEKKIKSGIQDISIDKVYNLLKSLSSIDTNCLNKFSEISTSNKYIQTDEDDIQLLKGNYESLEKENDKLKAKNQKYKNEIEGLNTEIIGLKEINLKLTKENRNISQDMEELCKVKTDLEKKYKSQIQENDNMKREITKNSQLIKEYEELKQLMEEKFQVEKEKLELEEKRRSNLIEFFKGDIKLLVYLKLFDKVTMFLNPSDLVNLRLSNSTINSEIEKNVICVKQFYINIIKQQRKKIKELNSFDIKKEYITEENEIEKLITDYVKNKKQCGKDLKNVILKAINFMNKEVKLSLGIKVNTSSSSTPKTNNTSSNQPANNKGFLGGISNYIGSSFFGTVQNNDKKSGNSSNNQTGTVGTPQKESQSIISSGNSSRTYSIAIHNDNLSEIDKFNISENLPINDIPDFEYLNPDEARSLLKRFLKSSFSTEKFSAFINELCNQYSEFLYYSYKSYCEIKDLEIIKNTLNERYRRYYKLVSSYEKNTIDRKNTNTSENYVKMQSTKKENGLSQLYEKISIYERKIELMNEREEKLSQDLEIYKEIFGNHIKNLQYDLEDMIKQRDSFRNTLLEFKKFYARLYDNSEPI